MSLRTYRPTYNCPLCGHSVTRGLLKCPSGHFLTWRINDARPMIAPEKLDAVGTSSVPVVPIVNNVPATDRGVLMFYVLLTVILGSALWYSLWLGDKYLPFSYVLVTALTTIAGFAVGVNSSPSRPQQE